MDRKKFQRKRYFFHEKDSRFNTGIICQSAFVIGQVQIKKIGLETLFLRFDISEIENVLLKCFPPPMTKLFLLHTIVFLHFTHHIKMAWERCQNAQKQFIIKTYKELILYKPVGKYHLTMACFRALAMIMFRVINCLISQPKHMLWVLIRTVRMRRFF